MRADDGEVRRDGHRGDRGLHRRGEVARRGAPPHALRPVRHRRPGARPLPPPEEYLREDSTRSGTDLFPSAPTYSRQRQAYPRDEASDPAYAPQPWFGESPRYGDDPRFRGDPVYGDDPRYRDDSPYGGDPRYRDEAGYGGDPRYDARRSGTPGRTGELYPADPAPRGGGYDPRYPDEAEAAWRREPGGRYAPPRAPREGADRGTGSPDRGVPDRRGSDARAADPRAAPPVRGRLLPPEERLRRPWIDGEGADPRARRLPRGTWPDTTVRR